MNPSDLGELDDLIERLSNRMQVFLSRVELGHIHEATQMLDELYRLVHQMRACAKRLRGADQLLNLAAGSPPLNPKKEE